jgi:hypothetical protein
MYSMSYDFQCEDGFLSQSLICCRKGVLYDLVVMMTEIWNTYLNAPVAETVWMTCGPEFRPMDNGACAVVITSALAV